MPNTTHIVPRRILSSLISSVSAGVVPRAGAPYMAIGRNDEIAALLSDLERVSEGEGAIRFIIGRYGSGKSFLIQLIRGYALEKDFVTADADLSPERRLYGTNFHIPRADQEHGNQNLSRWWRFVKIDFQMDSLLAHQNSGAGN